MATRQGTLTADPGAYLTAKLLHHHGLWQQRQPRRGGHPAGWRELEEQIQSPDLLGPDAAGTSHEQLRKLHNGKLGWRNVRPLVVVALAVIYEVPVDELSPEIAAQMSLTGVSGQALRSSAWKNAA